MEDGQILASFHITVAEFISLVSHCSHLCEKRELCCKLQIQKLKLFLNYLPYIQSLREKTMDDRMLHGRFVPWWLMVNHSWL